MEKITTNGIEVSVISRYNEEHSDPQTKNFIFVYWIRIENHSDRTVQLLNRHWVIKDSNANIKDVRGEGVVGKKPVLKPGETHEYNSWCPLKTPIGKMHGVYGMIDLEKEEEFDVRVPEFKLVANFKLN